MCTASRGFADRTRPWFAAQLPVAGWPDVWAMTAKGSGGRNFEGGLAAAVVSLIPVTVPVAVMVCVWVTEIGCWRLICSSTSPKGTS